MDYTSITLIVFAYLLGSIPWALVIGKIFYNKDIRKEGSGNLGGSNAGRVLGKKAGISVTLLDGSKALITVLLAAYLKNDKVYILAGLACCIGHCFPIFANFKGGKAVATSMGYLLALAILTRSYLLFLLPVVVFFIILYICKYVSLSSMVAIFSSFLFSILLKQDILVSSSLLALSIFVIYRHKSNIKRLIDKEEKKVTWI